MSDVTAKPRRRKSRDELGGSDLWNVNYPSVRKYADEKHYGAVFLLLFIMLLAVLFTVVVVVVKVHEITDQLSTINHRLMRGW